MVYDANVVENIKNKARATHDERKGHHRILEAAPAEHVRVGRSIHEGPKVHTHVS